MVVPNWAGEEEGIVSSCNKEDLCPSYPCPGSNFHKEFLGDGIHTRGESQTNAAAPSNIYTTQLKHTEQEKDKDIAC